MIYGLTQKVLSKSNWEKRHQNINSWKSSGMNGFNTDLLEAHYKQLKLETVSKYDSF